MQLQAAPPLINLQPIRVMLRGSFMQTLRRKEVFVLLLLLGLYALAALVLRIVGIQSPDAARFVLGLGLQLGSTLATLLVIVSAARALPPEFEQRTIYPVLAKPISRGELLLGKALPVWLSGCIALALFVIASALIAPGLPAQKLLVLAQAFLSKCALLAVITTLTFAMSLWLPTAINILTLTAFTLFGGTALNAIAQFNGLGSVAAGLLPNPTLFDHFQRYADGGAPLHLIAFTTLILHAFIWCCVFSALAYRRFARMWL